MDVWRVSVDLATFVYRVTDQFPKAEIYGLTSQMRRAVVSVPSNIAEGTARASAREFIQYLHIAGGSLSELDTQTEIAHNLCFLDNATKTTLDQQIDSISRKLVGPTSPQSQTNQINHPHSPFTIHYSPKKNIHHSPLTITS